VAFRFSAARIWRRVADLVNPESFHSAVTKNIGDMPSGTIDHDAA
jgi:hypothetical protein